ncbi:helix-turn-helix domain-containing protein [Paracoccus litorisediminis]|uniref:Helix-turn-helix domain-containing protein n=1 Tax=Paracoccus litorisediminis TaxID=2006130 RepID=A0A844HV43_9RHOB|nr:helix-turn-helix transcriptional regulator [Paracoccus litorisediminis]MTH61421.1 helix-turn-helix domain-containing protein [Paracoccus litorisediminis]
MNLQRIRRDRGLSQAELAEMAKVEQSMISKIENGFDGVTLRILRKLSTALEVEITDLLSDDRTTAERALIEAFRGLPPDRQQGWLDMAAMIAGPSSAKE